MTIVKDSGARATLPPFTDEHEELRETVSRFVAKPARQSSSVSPARRIPAQG